MGFRALALAAVLAFFVLPCRPATAWITEVLDGSAAQGSAGVGSSIALDSSGHVHISSRNESLDLLQYTTNASGDWASTIIAPAAESWHTSIAVDSADRVHIAFYGEDGSLSHATNASGAWTVTVVDAAFGDTTEYTSIAVDGSDHVHISYLWGPFGSRELRYATNASGAWAIETVDDAGDTGEFNDIAVDSGDHVHISYGSRPSSLADYALAYATNASGDWVTETVDADSEAGLWSSIALDAADVPHIAYAAGPTYTERILKYARRVGSEWVITTVDAGGSPGLYASLALDAAGAAHVAYHHDTEDTLRYATNASGAWVISTADADNGLDCALALDPYGNAHISHMDYVDWATRDLRYTTNVSGDWASETLGSVGNLGGYVSVAKDSADHLYVSFYDFDERRLEYATNASGDWVTTTVDDQWPTATVGTWTALVIDSQDHVHILYNGVYRLQHATNASGDWVISEIDDGGEGASYVSATVDAADHLHVGYTWEDWIGPFDLPHVKVTETWYATNASGSWTAVQVDEAGEGYTSVALDGAGAVHISYLAEETYGVTELRHATNAGGPWSIDVVDADGDGYTAIAVDGSDDIHIAYARGDELWHATDGSGAWVTDRVASEPAEWIDMAVDPSDHILVSYARDGTLGFARDVPGGWVTSAACERPFGCGAYSAVALASTGAVHVGHHGGDGTLLLTTSPPCSDGDGDGYGDPASDLCQHPELDCDDADPYVSPGAPEGPDGDPTCADLTDNDCDGDVDFDDLDCIPCYDEDMDGYGDPASGNCEHAELDCDDTDPDVNPGAEEGPYGDPTCADTTDNDCDGLIDMDDGGCVCNDGDVDGYGDPASPLCVFPEQDCDDGNRLVNPGAGEGPYGAPTCSDTLDNDCDTLADAADDDCLCNDDDGDGYGDPGSPYCAHPERDCDDLDPLVHPGVLEQCGGPTCSDGLDNDCDGLADAADDDCTEWCPSSTVQGGGGTGEGAGLLLLFMPLGIALALRAARALRRDAGR